MLGALANALKVGDLRNKLLITAAMLIIFRIGCYIPVPGVNAHELASTLGVASGNIFGFLDMFSGGALRRFTIFALGVNPYITASIIMQLLTHIVPSLEAMQKEGVDGRKKIQQYTRYGNVILGVIQGGAYALYARNLGVINDSSWFTLAMIVIVLTAGTSFLMWLGEQISLKGIGNGVSLIIFVGIIARIPPGFIQASQNVGAGGLNPLSIIAFVVLSVFVIAGVVFVQEARRRIPVQYAKRQVGRRMYGGQSTHIPMAINAAGVIPVIFASSVLTFPLTVAQFAPGMGWINNYFGYGTTLYLVAYGALVVFFTYFYTAVMYNPTDVADNIKKSGGFIPGYRPGKPTADYIDRVLTRITLTGAIFLAVIAVLPYLMADATGMPQAFINFGGTGLLIVVGVALNTMQQIESQLLMRHYQGFMK